MKLLRTDGVGGSGTATVLDTHTPHPALKTCFNSRALMHLKMCKLSGRAQKNISQVKGSAATSLSSATNTTGTGGISAKSS